jgi:metallo-beta-lactamase family protein
MLRDSAYIQESEAEWKSRKSMRAGGGPVEPLYTLIDAERAMKLFEGRAYNKPFEIFKGITVEFCDAGHLLGSASIYITVTEGEETRSVLFSGDLGNCARPLIRDPQPPKDADFVVIESTYGDRIHGERPDYIGQLTSILQDTFDRGGNVVIPSFAVGRTQELLYLLRTIKDQKLIKYHDNFSVYVDSPLAVEATNIYSSGLTEYYDRETLELLGKGIDPIRFPGLKLSITSDDSRAINDDKYPKVILSASGMCEAGRIRHHLKHNLWREESTILFVGYQTEGTVGRKLLNGAASVRLFGEEITVNANIEMIEGTSGHADKDMLLSWLANMPKPPKKGFVNHGGDDVCDHFANRIYEELGYFSAAPYSGDVYDLDTGECIEKAPVVRIPPKVSAARKRANAVFERLMLAGRRLMSVIEQNRGGANKDLAKFTSQIDALSDKWERK